MARTLNCAHRGASGKAPENTLAALRLAVEHGADMAEIDVRLTADQQLVLMHDATLERTTDGSGILIDHTLRELQRLDAGSWFDAAFAGEPIPSLTDALKVVGGRLSLNIELKPTGSGRILAAAVAATVTDADRAETDVITSFDHAAIDWLGRHHPRLRCGYILSRVEPADLEASVDVLSVKQDGIDENLVTRLHEAGKQVHAWTVNDEDRMRDLIALGVDAIITNHPDRLAGLLG